MFIAKNNCLMFIIKNWLYQLYHGFYTYLYGVCCNSKTQFGSYLIIIIINHNKKMLNETINHTDIQLQLINK